MAELQPSTKDAGAIPPTPDAARPQQRGPPPHQIYVLPAPIRTFPLPAFYPNNPISLFHVVCAWLGQIWSPPGAEPSVVHEGVWSPSTSSVHITDEKSTRALWEQGFYGKGSLSRSEPNWLKRELVRKGLEDAHVSEILTVQRREERIRAKWERARLEQEAIRQTRLAEAREAEARQMKSQTVKKLPDARLAVVTSEISSPVTPQKLLSLPNSVTDYLVHMSHTEKVATGDVASSGSFHDDTTTHPELGNGASNSSLSTLETIVNGQQTGTGVTTPGSPASSDGAGSSKRRKSVRFSPKVDSTTFELMDPPSPKHALSSPRLDFPGMEDLSGALNVGLPEPVEPAMREGQKDVIINKEHLQLMPEEAFWLSFGLGVLSVIDPVTGKAFSHRELLTLFRQYSYFPPRVEPEEPALQPDDDFLVHYAVYHHFRSLGWVPRGGIKFGVDWLLYTRGPVFDHAEFGLIVIPSYSDPLWAKTGKQPAQKNWQWLHATIRVLSHVTKSLVLVYVDVPSPSKFDEALEKGLVDVFELYKVREVMVKRCCRSAPSRALLTNPRVHLSVSKSSPSAYASRRWFQVSSRRASEAQPILSNKNSGKPTAFEPRAILDGKINGGNGITVSSSDRFIQIEDKDQGGWTRLDAVALRDSCECVKCTDPSSGQKNFASTDVPANIEIDQIRLDKDGVGIAFKNDIPRLARDGHEMILPWETIQKTLGHKDILRIPYPRQDAVYPKTGRTFWDVEVIEKRIRKIDYHEFIKGEDAFWETLLDLSSLGLVFLKNVPHDENSIVNITTRIANIKETFYGRTFDVRAKPDAENVAYTSGYLGLHQDLLYLERPPAIQLLHCMENSCSGGESLFSDGLRAGKLLWLQQGEETRRHVENLARVRIPYHYEKHGYWYKQKRALLDVTEDDILASIYWSPPFQDRFQLPTVDMRAWLEPAQLFDQLLNDESAMYQVKMAPGECVLFDNMRVMHGRRAFDSSGGSRWLRGAYIEREDFVSRVLHTPDALAEAYRGGEAWDRATEDRKVRESSWFGDVKARLEEISQGLKAKGAVPLGEEQYQQLNA
ncbi:hypothetical protein BGZ63DRAFT_357263 [Mariannaea sp. PMI_226]|nr:hypothetical protein BGZ63DRAFT_357263 [Mariannaea sp. PMI_226]